jgi:NAD dependent epimerase/dehydratase family enzyme
LIFGEGASVLTTGQRVLPERTMSLGYEFHYTQIAAALAATTRIGR